MPQGDFKGVSRVFQVIQTFKASSRGVSRGVLRGFQGSFIEVSRIIHRSFMDLSKKFLRSSIEVSRKFQDNGKVFNRSLKLL